MQYLAKLKGWAYSDMEYRNRVAREADKKRQFSAAFYGLDQRRSWSWSQLRQQAALRADQRVTDMIDWVWLGLVAFVLAVIVCVYPSAWKDAVMLWILLLATECLS